MTEILGRSRRRPARVPGTDFCSVRKGTMNARKHFGRSAARRIVAGLAVLMAITAGMPFRGQAEEMRIRIYVGTYTRAGSQGIYLLHLDPQTGALDEPELVAQLANPAFLARHPERDWLYAVSQVGDFQGERSGGVYAFRIDPSTGRLTEGNIRLSGGATACHLSLDRSGRYVLVANYSDGNARVFPLLEDGRLGEASDSVQHEGSSVDPRRQRGPHAHWIQTDPTNRFVWIADLGLDRVMIYRFDAERGTLRPHNPPWVELAPGAGPRHAAFHPSGERAYVINELNSTITAWDYAPQQGVAREIHTVSTLPDDFSGENTTAEILIHPSGRFLYGSNRGHDSLAVMAIDPDTGRLQPVEYVPTGGSIPRNFGISPEGRFLVVGNQGSDSLVVFRIDDTTGRLRPTGHRASLSMPVCVRMELIHP